MVEMAAKAGTLPSRRAGSSYLPALGAGFSAFAVENKPRSHRSNSLILTPINPTSCSCNLKLRMVKLLPGMTQWVRRHYHDGVRSLLHARDALFGCGPRMAICELVHPN